MRTLLAAALLAAGAAGAAGAAAPAALAAPAHVEPTVTSAPAGSRAELGFTIEHGCAGSPTVELAMQLPLEVADPVPVDVPGWTTTVAPPDPAGHVVVTWQGGPLPDGEAATFTVSVGLPPTPGVTLLFPTVQVCEQGELAWIAEEGGASESDNPAPRITLTELDPAVTTSTTAEAPTPTSPATDGTATTTAPDGEGSGTPTTAAPGGDDEGGTSPWIWVGIGVAAAAVVAAVVVGRGRRGDRPSP